MNKIKIRLRKITMVTDDIVVNGRESLSSEKFTILLYEEDNLKDQVNEIMDRKGWEYAYCLHDRDIKEDGTPDKPHYQYLIRKKNESTISAVAKTLGINSRHIQKLKSWRGFCIYLIHADEKSKKEGKYQYPVENIQGNIREDVIAEITKKRPSKSHDSDIVRVLDWIETQPIIQMSNLMRWACEEHLISVVQRMASLVRQCVSEHNENLRYNKKIIDLWEQHDKLVVAENRRFTSQLHVKSEIGNQEMVKQEMEQHLVNMELIKEILENK